jgi:putative protease
MEATYARDGVARPVALAARVYGEVGGPLTVRVTAAGGGAVEVSWPGPLERALKHPLSEAAFRESFGRLGETPFELGAVALDVPEPVLAPKSVLNDLRRQAVARLLEQREAARRRAVAEPDALERLRAGCAKPQAAEEGAPQLYVLVRTMEQLDAALAWRPAMVYCDFEDVRRYGDAVERAHAAGVPVGLATLRVVKPGEEGLLHALARHGADALLVRNLAALTLYRELSPRPQLVGDFALNVANELTADLLARAGLGRLVPSYDLNWEQLAALLGRAGPGLFEVVVHQHMPMFHMEHCVFAAFMSKGTSFLDCGRPCEKHRVHLRDRVGIEHPLRADVGCRNTLFNAVPQTGARFFAQLQSTGLRDYRIELLEENAVDSERIIRAYQALLAGRQEGEELSRTLKAQSQLGVTRGTFET